MEKDNISVVMFGARAHYAVPRIFNKHGLLDRFYADIIAVQGWPQLLGNISSVLLPTPLNRLKARVPEGIPLEKITSYPFLGLMHQLHLSRARSLEEQLKCHMKSSIDLNKRIIRGKFIGDGVLYTFDRAGLELMQYVKARGGATIMEQTVIPFRAFRKFVTQEQSAFPEWNISGEQGSFDWFAEREEQEWQIADLIICGSEFVKQTIADCGGPAGKCEVVPYGIDGRFSASNKKKIKHTGPLRVLTVGEVGLRKGSPYVYEAARKLQGIAEFRMVGGFNMSSALQAKVSGTLNLVGHAPRSIVKEHFEWADVFLLPSLVEGSALVTYEALAAGLPVICTPNTGSVVRDGYNGYIVPVRDVDAICEKISGLVDDKLKLYQVSQNALKSDDDYSFETYSRNLIAGVNEFLKGI